MTERAAPGGTVRRARGPGSWVFILLGSIVLAVALLSLPSRAAHPNIVLIIADDLAPGVLAFEGNESIRTPNLSRLAREGTVFDRAYVPIAQCAPSRAAMLSGLYPHQTGVTSNFGARWNDELVSVAQVLNGQGYRSGLVGKWHLRRAERAQAGFEDFWRPAERGRSIYYDPDLWVDGRRVRIEGYLPEVLTDRAIEYIDRDDPRPFFLWLAYKTPHLPLVVPPGDGFRYDPEKLTLPKSMSDDLSTKPAAQREGYSHEQFEQTPVEALKQRAALYYGMIEAMDGQVGRLLDHLDARGLAEETLVVFVSDNGLLRGEHQMVTKGASFYEELVRVPLVFRGPGVPAGARKDALVSTLDLFPTFAAVAGAEVSPLGLAGVDLGPLLRDEVTRVHERLYLEYRQKKETQVPMIGIVTPQHKYARYLTSGEEELYDLEADPLELDNLARTPEGSEVRKSLADHADAFLARIAVPFWTTPGN